jgi:[protein-PII] uridylyltransferase
VSASDLERALEQAADDAAWREIARKGLSGAREALRDLLPACDESLVATLIASFNHACDGIVRSAWRRCLPATDDIALFAIGGYGRGELYPHSDIDVLVFAEPAAQARHAAEIARFLALLWDAGLAAGSAVRSAAQCGQAAGEDIASLTAMMERRLLGGGAEASARLGAAIAPERVWAVRPYFEAKREEQRARHARFNDTAHNLEPNLKEGPGGLRDLQTVTWMAMRLFGVRGLRELVPLGLLGEDECASLEREWKVLARLRFGLHVVAGRREDRLLFDHQRSLAQAFGLQDAGADNLAIEQMMQGFFRAAQVVMRINERLLQRFEEQLAGQVESQPLEPGFELRNGYLHLLDPGALRAGMPAILDVFEAWGGHEGLRGLHSETARALAEALPTIRPYAEQPAEVTARFLALLRSAQAVRTLTRMAQLGVLSRYLPEFGKVSGRMQYDLFHVYTVDQHTLTVLRHIEGFGRGPDPRFSGAHELYPTLRKPELLLIAGLFHDIAKGRGGDHSELGSEDVRRFADAHGLPPADVDLLAWLVREHLLMSVTAQRQDISDPDVVTRFATRVADREHLDYLYLLTCADIAGTSPKLWNAWKDRLLADLHAATRYALRRGLENPLHADELIAEAREQALALLREQGEDEAAVKALWSSFPAEAFLRYRPEQIVWQTRGVLAEREHESQVGVRAQATPGQYEVFVRTPDRDGLFAGLVAMLDRLGLGILQARILNSSDGHALDSFQVLGSGEHPPSPAQIELGIREALRDPARIKVARRAVPRLLRHFKVPPRAEFATVNGRTRLSLVGPDRPGLLAEVAQVFRRHRLRVHDARIATFGERVEDFFLLSDSGDRPLEDPELLAALEASLIACLEGKVHEPLVEPRPA